MEHLHKSQGFGGSLSSLPRIRTQLIAIQERIIRNSSRSLINENLKQTKKLQTAVDIRWSSFYLIVRILEK
jgi:uncharacterized protein YjaG (DUF416 family)